IQDANVVDIFELDRAFDRLNDLRIRRTAVAVQNFKTDQVGTGSDPMNVVQERRAGRVCPVSGDDAGNMRAVAVVIVHSFERDKALGVDDLREKTGEEPACTLPDEVLINMYATVDDRHAD